MTETQTNGQQEGGYTPASFEKRTAAWMGIAYTVMLCFVLNYALYTGGGNLPGTFPDSGVSGPCGHPHPPDEAAHLPRRGGGGHIRPCPMRRWRRAGAFAGLPRPARRFHPLSHEGYDRKRTG